MVINAKRNTTMTEGFGFLKVICDYSASIKTLFLNPLSLFILSSGRKWNEEFI